ncbi:packaged DNA stabilization gp4 family protein [Lysobacter enzymogenes]|uniref:packaged DNA stabilization gp4 family protein n=1 Tax=Lysobacter enzymogenes TaxID=69 RepID=UPI00384DF593
MSTVAEVIRDALSHLRVQDPRQALKPEHARDGIRALNLMMRRWEADGLSLGWSDVAEPTDEMPVPPEAIEAIGFNLACKMRPRFGIPLDPDLKQEAEDGYSALLTDVHSNLYVRTSYEDLPSGEAQGCGRGSREGYNG